jgi:hypothetical protein
MAVPDQCPVAPGIGDRGAAEPCCLTAMSLAATRSGRLWLRRGKQKIVCPAMPAAWEGDVAGPKPPALLLNKRSARSSIKLSATPANGRLYAACRIV